MAVGQGPINCLTPDCRQELTTLGEPLVVVMEVLQPLRAGEPDADANHGHVPIEPFVLEALEDPKNAHGAYWEELQGGSKEQPRSRKGPIAWDLERDNPESGCPALLGPLSSPSQHPQRLPSDLGIQTWIATFQCRVSK